jgi:adenylate cyclase
VRSVGREPAVRYVLGGSIRRAGERLRVAAELIGAVTGRTLWAARSDGIMGDVFALQDEISAAVVGAMAPWLTAAEVERAHRHPPDRLEAYHLFLRALPAVRAMREPENARGLDLVSQALALDPAYAVAAGLGAWAHTLRAAQAWQTDPAIETAEGLGLAELALAHGASDAEALSCGGYAVGFLGAQIERGLVAVDRALELNPNSAQAYANAGWLRVFAGQFPDAIAMFRSAERVSPRDPERFRPMAGQSFCHVFLGNLDQAVAVGRAAIAANPAYTPTYRAVAAALGHLGAHEEAKAAMAELRRRAPHLTMANAVERSIFRHCGRLPYLLEGLRIAGLPDEPA